MVLFDKDLAMYFSFSEGSGAIVFDRSKYQNNGDITGAIFLRPYEDMSNDSDDEGDSPLVIIDDGGVAFWTLVAGVESDDVGTVKKGINSYKTALTADLLDMYHDYGANQDWSYYDYLTIWIYGCNTTDTIRVEAWNEVYAGKTNGYFYAITDDFTGWRRFIIPLERFTDIVVPTGWENIRCIRLLGGAPQTCDYFFDRTIIDVGNWRFGEALDFDGTNDVVTIPHSASLSLAGTDMTIGAWVNVSSVDIFIVVNKGTTAAIVDGYILYLSNDGKVHFHSKMAGESGGVASVTSYALDEWVHVVGVRTIDSIKIYINGILDNSSSVTGGIPLNANPVHIGFWSAYALYTAGLLDEVRIYDRALTPEEIRTLYKEREVD